MSISFTRLKGFGLMLHRFAVVKLLIEVSDDFQFI